ncbi:MAG: hypothetical protein IJJ22_01035, partial [Oscillospiraceae bacterium]|nr:hypothetical protein [Oscillospiraceae bacterium]
MEKAQYPDYTGKIVISEIMPKNSATRVNGRYDDWVELLNLSDEHTKPVHSQTALMYFFVEFSVL